jgi:arylsulfatase A
MNIVKTSLLALAVSAATVWPAHTRAADAPARPNIIFVLADDLGLDGVSAYGADTHKTPNIDALAASGIRFDTAYAAPLCGPSRCLLMTGRYAFRTGGITNASWRPGGPGAKSADEVPIAKLLKQAGYATGQAGKWRQVGEWPKDWGFDEYLTDNTASGWYWQTQFNKNGTVETLPQGTYGPDVVENFAFDFIERHKAGPFFFYYATHLVHKPTLRTPDTAADTRAIEKLYDDNIRYMDKQVGNLVAELDKLGIRKNTLIVFGGDNGTAVGYPSPVHGRMINGVKGSMLEGGSHIPFIASWPAVTPAGKVSKDLISFADPYATFAELAGAKVPDTIHVDGKSFAPQLRGETGTPRDVAYVQLGAHWFVRDAGFKMNEQGELFDLSDAPFVEKPVPAASDTDATRAERQRLAAALADLDPAKGKADSDGNTPAGRRQRLANRGTTRPADETADAPKAGPWTSGNVLAGPDAPRVADKPLDITAAVDASGQDGVIVAQGGAANGYALYVQGGKLAFSVREAKDLTTITAKDPLGTGHFQVEAKLAQDGALALTVDGKTVATGKAAGLIPQQPKAPFTVGKAGRGTVADYEASASFGAKVSGVEVKTALTN